MNKKQVEDKLNLLVAQEEQMRANLFATQGAIQVLKELLSEDSLTMNELKDLLGAKEIGEPELLGE
jgi:hypothetical protein